MTFRGRTRAHVDSRCCIYRIAVWSVQMRFVSSEFIDIGPTIVVKLGRVEVEESYDGTLVSSHTDLKRQRLQYRLDVLRYA